MGRRGVPGLLLAVAAAGALACAPAEGSEERQARNTLVVGIDVSGSFNSLGRYESAIDFAAHYIYAHINGLGGLRTPTSMFVGSIGGEKGDEWKSFQPIHTFQTMSVPEIASYLRRTYPVKDGLTDFNPFFERVATLVKRQNLVLAPLEIVVFSDGEPDLGGKSVDDPERYARIDVSQLEYLSRSVTVRVLYPRPTIAVHWERQVPRRRVRMWTVDDEVMTTWRRHLQPGLPLEAQADLWKWIGDNVDFKVRTKGIL
ncbi:MAG TPA: hypothetical protein VMM18_10535 [Gemmatimonadaceae bacterium]|nr:hypothetical protein [Gemmatimonadaceae bacterium]